MEDRGTLFERVEEERILAAHRNGLPVLWMALFSAGALQFEESDEGEVVANFLCDKREAIERLRGRTAQLTKLFHGQAEMAGLVGMLAEYLSRAEGTHIFMELAEIAMMGELESFVERVAAFLEWLSSPAPVPAAAQRRQDGLLARLFGRSVAKIDTPATLPVAATEFLRIECNLSGREMLPNAAQVANPSNQPEAMQQTIQHLLGGTWIRTSVPWEP
jgi:hypothetical protein